MELQKSLLHLARLEYAYMVYDPVSLQRRH